MKRVSILTVITAGLMLAACSRKAPEFVNSIPDDAVAVATLHPMQLHSKSKINTFENIKKKVKNEVWNAVLDDPLSTGLMMDEYVYLFVRMEDPSPIIGVVAGMKDKEKFEAIMGKIKDGIEEEYKQGEGYTYIQPDKEGVIGWNEKQMIVLAAPDYDEFEESFWTQSLDGMFSPVKEESITSLVDFKDFLGGMKDMNFWISSNEIREIVEKMAPDKIPDFPVALYNNYAHVYVDFANGEMHVAGETRFSEEVEKNVEQFLVMKPSMNNDILKLAPGGNLLVALAGSVDLGKTREMVSKFAPPQLDSMGGKLENFTGVPTRELLDAFTGDFTISVNGVEGEAMIPVEIFIGLGVNGEAIQEKLMESVKGMAPVEQEGDFFVINIQGNQIYSGVINNMWVITNAKGYKDEAGSGSLKKSLVDSRFNDFADGSMGVYVNLNLDNYPMMVKGMLDQKPEKKTWIQHVTGPFDYLGISASNYRSNVLLKTTESSENSLYTILKVANAGHDESD